ncbi:YkvA family protein [Gracilibacillus alcaliphilus]|uniref:YkvA family protein n=1 Tax=Gracilibacillus alcaliphilus TaxID=1401441 RepID=UPI00195905B6|nr:DUF1232 domain-containing protein [Gracilibacillus alcaliphilus]MBM7679266.1 uncharacterized membrane protein YkvA (DUF1232 family) [Gracilibacillus alcaliphilus]
MRFFKRVKFLFQFRQSIPFFKEFYLSREVTIASKLISVLLIIGYAVFPFDLIPDYLLVLGIFDDIVVISFILQLMVKMAPDQLKTKYNLKQ